MVSYPELSPDIEFTRAPDGATDVSYSLTSVDGAPLTGITIWLGDSRRTLTVSGQEDAVQATWAVLT